jgi:transglutaminase-like putative cysteine protease
VLPELDATRFLATIPVEVSSVLGAEQVELASSYAGPNLGELASRKLLLERRGQRLRVRSGPGYWPSTEPVTDQERNCSFVLDCDDPAVVPLIAELRRNSPSPQAADVTAFVAKHIEHKHLARGFDIASVVARTREGDCTEHAVLTAALLRGVGIPSHVVTGVVLFEADGKRQAFGHAWTEYYDGERWRLSDATAVGLATDQIIYLPVGVLRSEGPGFSRALYDGFQTVDIESVTVPGS